jgi:hypothetical protein
MGMIYVGMRLLNVEVINGIELNSDNLEYSRIFMMISMKKMRRKLVEGISRQLAGSGWLVLGRTGRQKAKDRRSGRGAATTYIRVGGS